MSVSKAVVLCLALLLAAEAVTGANVTKFDTPKGPLRPDNDTDASKSSEERASIVDTLAPLFKQVTSKATLLERQHWNKISTSATVMFNNWKLHEDSWNLFNNPKFLEWIYYAVRKSPQDNSQWVAILMQKFHPVDFTKAIKVGMESPNEHIRTLAKHLQLTRYEILTKEDNFIPADTLKELDIRISEPFLQPVFQQWYEFCETRYTAEDIAFELQLSFNNDYLLSALAKGKEVESTKKLATKVYAGLLEYYSNAPVNPTLAIFGPTFYEHIVRDLTTPRYTLWKEIVYKDADISEDKMFIDALRKEEEYSDFAIAHFILRSERNKDHADIIPTLKNRFVTELAHSNEAEFEEIREWLYGMPFEFKKPVIQERNKYLGVHVTCSLFPANAVFDSLFILSSFMETTIALLQRLFDLSDLAHVLKQARYHVLSTALRERMSRSVITCAPLGSPCTCSHQHSGAAQEQVISPKTHKGKVTHAMEL